MGAQVDSIRCASRSVDRNYERAVRLMHKCKGKIVVTGIGKSGLIAQKIASTFSSTGTEAIFLHPADGMHGGLGVINKNDIILALGKSGESEELLTIIPSIKKIGAKVICITANKNSSLAGESTLVLHCPIDKEAGALNLAPTTSSTSFLVIGDALALTIMEIRGFGVENFALFHPGGTLGKRLILKVSDVMRKGRNNPVVKINSSIEKLLVEITRKWAGAASVVDRNGKLVGVVTDYDIRKAFAMGKNIIQVKIRDIMNFKPVFIYSDELAVKCFYHMETRKKPLTVIPVIDRKKKSVGMIHLHDLVAKGLFPDRD